MNAFEYANPTSVEDAVSLLADTWGDTEVLAGGTDLITSMKQGLTSPRLVVSLSSVKGLGGITKKGDALQIGATTTLSELVANADVQKHFPALVTAANNIGSTQMLNMGTVGGDLLQRPRCWYFRNGFGLLAMHNGLYDTFYRVRDRLGELRGHLEADPYIFKRLLLRDIELYLRNGHQEFQEHWDAVKRDLQRLSPLARTGLVRTRVATHLGRAYATITGRRARNRRILGNEGGFRNIAEAADFFSKRLR